MHTRMYIIFFIFFSFIAFTEYMSIVPCAVQWSSLVICFSPLTSCSSVPVLSLTPDGLPEVQGPVQGPQRLILAPHLTRPWRIDRICTYAEDWGRCSGRRGGYMQMSGGRRMEPAAVRPLLARLAPGGETGSGFRSQREPWRGLSAGVAVPVTQEGSLLGQVQPVSSQLTRALCIFLR